MSVRLDGNDLAITGSTLGGVLDLARQEAETQRRVITDVVMDGQALTGDALDRSADADITGHDIELTTADPAALVSGSLLDAADALEASRPQLDELATSFQTGKHATALPKLAEVLGVWQVAQDVLTHGFALLGQDPESIPGLYSDKHASQHTGTGLGPLVDQLTAQLAEIRRSVEDQDFSAIADTLVYDLGPLAEPWSDALRRAAQLAAGQAGSG
ncbi:MAG: hypothetical protein AAGF47_12425 [Planctomycetota bacterium]